MNSRFGALALAVFALTACKPMMDGDITVQNPLPVKVTVKTGFRRYKVKDYTIPAGRYDVKIGTANPQSVALVVENSGQPGTIWIDVPRGAAIPKNGGPIHWAAADTGQPWDADGELMVQTSTTPEVSGMESCTFTRDEYTCDYYGNPPVSHCYLRPVTYWGQRQVRYYQNVTDRTLTLDLTSPESHARLSTLSGSQRETENVYTYVGYCY